MDQNHLIFILMSSFFVSYNPTCRICCKTHGAKHMFNIVNSENLEKYKKMTEFELSFLLEGWLNEIENSCVFCGSRNIFGDNIEVGNYKLYDYQRMVNDFKKRIACMQSTYYPNSEKIWEDGIYNGRQTKK